MSGTGWKIGVAVIELAGSRALCEAVGGVMSEASTVAGICRGEAPDRQTEGAVWVPSAGATVPQRRRSGGAWLLDETGADPVVLLEDTTDLVDGWAAALDAGFADPAVGCLWGPVEVSPALPARFRALGRLEYGRFATGSRDLPAPPGNALALRAGLLARHIETRDGLVEADLGETLAAAGQHMAFSPKFRAVYARCDLHGALLSTRFQHGRLYASGAAAKAGMAGRAALALKSLAVPPVLSLRAVTSAFSGNGAGPALAETGWIVAMSVAWGLGECAGALFGPGQSQGSWR